ncbi:MAG: hypothetical protein NZ534_03075, partial [Bacteroidia bacterium]|nr:hypothetical protein [Bacteroidia bacterium]
VASGTGTLQYRWSNVVTGFVHSYTPEVSLSPATTTDYQIQISDDCTTRFDPFRITVVPASLSVQPLAAPAVVCEGAQVALTAVASGGSGNYTYVWNPPAPNAATANFVIAAPTTVSVTVSDGCMSVSQSVFIATNQAPEISAYGDVNICLGSSTTIGANISGGFGAVSGPIWTNAAGNVVGTGNTISVAPQSTTYFVATAIDECNVAARDTVRIVVFDSMAVGQLPDTAICFGQSVQYAASISGSGTVRWVDAAANITVASGPTATLAPPQTTTYRLEVEDSCFVLTRSFTVTVHPPDLEISQNLPSAGPVVCSGSTVTLSVSALGGTGVYHFVWSDGQTGATIQHLVPGDETVRVRVEDGCRADSTAFTFVTDPPVFATAAGSINICEGSSTALSVAYSGGLPPFVPPVWTTADGSVVGTGDVLTVSPLQTTRYYVLVSDACGTTALDSVTVRVFGPFGVGDLDDRTICFGEQTTYVAQIAGVGQTLWEQESNGTYVFVSDQISATLSPTATTRYRLTVSDSCFTVVREFTVEVVPPTLALNLSASVPSPVCLGTPVTFVAQATGGSQNYSYTWSDGATGAQTTVVVSGPTSVYVDVFDGCRTVSDTLYFDIVGTPVLSASGDATICLGSSTTLQAFGTGGAGTLQYSWTVGGVQVGSAASIAVSPTETTTYQATVVDECGAAASVELTVTVLSPFGLGTIEDRTICYGEQTTYVAPVTGAAEVFWVRVGDNAVVGTSSSVTLSPSVSSDYRLVVFDECFIDTVEFTVNVIPATLTIDSLAMNPPPPVCVGTPITLTAYVSGGSGQYQYEWSQDNSGTATLQTTVTGAGIVTVRVSDGCQTATAFRTFSDNPDLSIDAGPDLTICQGQVANLFVTFTGGFGNPDNFQWIDLTTNQTVSVGPVAPVSPSSSRSYRVILADDCGTSASDTVSVFLFEPLFVAPPMDTVICEG